jgi:hypothetical protein
MMVAMATSFPLKIGRAARLCIIPSVFLAIARGEEPLDNSGALNAAATRNHRRRQKTPFHRR